MDSKVAEKIEIFSKEFSYIKNQNYLEDAKLLMSRVPDYFYRVAASSTGKYHPDFACLEGGLVKHTKVAVRIAQELLTNNTIGSDFTDREKDLIIMALLFHDALKHGKIENKHTVFNHPIEASNFIIENKEDLKMNENDIELLTSMIKTHMGEWTKDYFGNEVLEKPTTKLQKFVHMCDFLSSKKFLDVKFNNYTII